MARKKKGNCLMRMLKFVFVFCFFLVVIVGMNTDTKSTNDKPTVTFTAKPEETKTIEELKDMLKSAQATEAPTAEPTSKPTETPTTTVSKKDIDAIKNLLKEAMAGFSYSNVSGDETGFTLTVAMDGLAAEVAAAKASKEKSEGWADVRKVSVLMCNNASGMIKNFGMTNAVCALYVVNDINHDDVLLFVLDGQIVFDCMDIK